MIAPINAITPNTGIAIAAIPKNHTAFSADSRAERLSPAMEMPKLTTAIFIKSTGEKNIPKKALMPSTLR